MLLNICSFSQTISYVAERMVGTGAFGVVYQVCGISQHLACNHNSLLFSMYCVNNIMFCYFTFYFGRQAKCLETGEAVAIKKVLQDKRYKNRELQIMHLLDHPNVVQLKHCFYSTTEKDELYLNLVLEYISETVHRVSRHFNRMNHQHMPIIYAQLYTYQVNFVNMFIFNMPFLGLFWIH